MNTAKASTATESKRLSRAEREYLTLRSKLLKIALVLG